MNVHIQEAPVNIIRGWKSLLHTRKNKTKKHRTQSHEQFLDEAGHYDSEAHANAMNCDHPNDFWPDEAS